MKEFTVHHVKAENEGLTVEAYLKDILGYSGRRIQKLTRQKGITLNSKAVFLQRWVKAGDVIRILALSDVSFGVEAEPGALEILYEDNQLIILNKPAGILVHPAGQTTHGTLSNYLAHYYHEQGKVCTVRPLHRLDRETSGCVIFAKDSRTQTQLESLLRQGDLKRTYRSVAEGIINPPLGTIDAPIGAHPTKPNRRAVNPNGDPAITHYKTLQALNSASLLELTLETGRTHQIRVHLSSLGHPLIGDRMYGKGSALIAGQALHAFSVKFPHPIQNRAIYVEAPYPVDFAKVLEQYKSRFA